MARQPVKCRKCKKWFTRSSLNVHLRIHAGERLFECEHCPATFTEKGNLTRHQLVHTGVKAHQCDICQQSFTLKNALVNHTRIHTKEKPYKCDRCERVFAQLSTLQHHICNHVPENQHKCLRCEKTFAQKGARDAHLTTHDGRTFQCKVCGKTYSYKRSLTQHELTFHSVNPDGTPAAPVSFPCEVCGKRIRDKYGFKKHLQRHETKDKAKKTPENALNQQQETTECTLDNSQQENSRPYQCDLCGKAFRREKRLVVHRRKHTGEKPHSCFSCQKTFRRLRRLRTHLKDHVQLENCRYELCVGVVFL